MVTYRLLTSADYLILSESLKDDEFHRNTNPIFFVEPYTITTVYEDEKGIVLFLRGSIVDSYTIRLDIQFLDNKDSKRNLKTMLDGFPKLSDKAKKSGFKELKFESNVPLLRKFCIKRLGFQEDVDNWLKLVL